jgi:alanine racemase
MSLRKQVDSLLRGFEKEFSTHNRIEVSRRAIVHNLELFKKLSGKQVIPVLKGNAYGHGVDIVAKALKGRNLAYIAVDGYFEALRIREVSKQPVLVMGAIKPENFKRMKYSNFAFVVQDEVTIRALGETNKKVKVHLECNTGMNRYGAKPAEVADLTKCILQYKNLELEGVMSHLADADGDDPATVQLANDLFDTCVDTVRKAGGRPTLIHIAQTAGSTASISKYANAVRLGVGLYGINPFGPEHPAYNHLKELRPALKLISTITKIIELEAGDKVSYNYTFTAPKRMRVGVLPLGYYEGLSRELSNTGAVRAGETYLPIVGRVCMNHTMIALKDSKAHVGDEVVVYSDRSGDRNSIDRIAAKHQLFNYSLLTSLSQDLRRVIADVLPQKRKR